MKTTKIVWIGLTMMIILAVSLVWMACRNIPNDENRVAVTLKVNLPEKNENPSPLKEVAPSGVEAQAGVNPPPSQDIYHLKVMLTNPPEVHYVYNFTPGVPVSIWVGSGTNRQVSVEVYQVYSSILPNALPAEYYISDPVTVNLQGEPVSLTITTYADYSNLGDIAGGQVSLIRGDTTEILYNLSCPSHDYYVNIRDLDWGGLSFPSASLDLGFGMTATLTISRLPLGHTFLLNVFHDTAGFYDNIIVGMGDTTIAVNVLFKGYTDPTIVFNPSRLPDLSPGTSVSVRYSLSGGYGGMGTANVGEMDTCGGSLAGGTYSFIVPDQSSCVIDVNAEDCQANRAEGQMTVGIK